MAHSQESCFAGKSLAVLAELLPKVKGCGRATISQHLNAVKDQKDQRPDAR